MLGDSNSYQMIDFWVNTYSENFDSKSVFSIPSNCNKQCIKSNLKK